MKTNNWQSIQSLSSHSYTCGHCGRSLASEKGWLAHEHPNTYEYIYICHHCGKPTYFDLNEKQTPGIIFGNDVADINDKEVDELYNEARKCTNNNAFTAAILCCRKLLMHLAVAKGAKLGLGFIEYVEYLSNQNYIPPDAKYWVDHIRKKGNEANHEIVIMGEGDAKDLIIFCEMLLKLIYEFPANIKRKQEQN